MTWDRDRGLALLSTAVPFFALRPEAETALHALTAGDPAETVAVYRACLKELIAAGVADAEAKRRATRRVEVAAADEAGVSQPRIARRVGCSVATVERDLRAVRALVAAGEVRRHRERSAVLPVDLAA